MVQLSVNSGRPIAMNLLLRDTTFRVAFAYEYSNTWKHWRLAGDPVDAARIMRLGIAHYAGQGPKGPINAVRHFQSMQNVRWRIERLVSVDQRTATWVPYEISLENT